MNDDEKLKIQTSCPEGIASNYVIFRWVWYGKERNCCLCKVSCDQMKVKIGYLLANGCSMPKQKLLFIFKSLQYITLCVCVCVCVCE